MTCHSLERVLASDQLPSLPEVAVKVIEIAKQPEPDIQSLIDTIRADGAIAGRILKFANSALFGVRHKPSSIEAAVPLLGTTMVRTVVLGFSLAKFETSSDELRPWFQQIWRESLIQASTAETLAERIPSLDAPTWFLAGLLQDIGRLALLSTCGTEYVQNVLAADDNRSMVQREVATFGYSHVDVSVGLCRKWTLDPSIVESIAVHHHSVEDVLPNVEHSRTSLAAALIAANCCSDYMEEVVRELTYARKDLEKLLILDFGLRPDEVVHLLADVDCHVNELASGFSIDVGNMPSRESILSRAQNALVEIAMRSHLARLAPGKAADIDPLPLPVDGDEEDTVDQSQWLDDCTGIYSMDFLTTSLPHELARNHERNSSTAFLCLDVAAAGDDCERILRGVTSIVRDNIRPADAIVRYGRTQLLVLLSGLNIDMLSGMAEHISSELHSPASPPGTDVRIAGMVHLPSGRRAVDTKAMLKELDRMFVPPKSTEPMAVSMQVMHGTKVRPVKRAAAVS